MILTFWDVVVIIASLVITILLGLIKWDDIFKKSKNEDNGQKKSLQDYILAKNQIGFIATGASLAASYSSGFGMIAMPVQIMVSGVVIYAGTVIAMVVAIVLINAYGSVW